MNGYFLKGGLLMLHDMEILVDSVVTRVEKILIKCLQHIAYIDIL